MSNEGTGSYSVAAGSFSLCVCVCDVVICVGLCIVLDPQIVGFCLSWWIELVNSCLGDILVNISVHFCI